jgi:hypothetical protein
MEAIKQRFDTRYTIHDTYDNLPHNHNPLKELLTFLANELAATCNEIPTDLQLKIFLGSSKIIM